MASKNVAKTKKLNGSTLVKAIELMFRNVKSGNTIYIAFSKTTFYFLVFTLTMAIMANIILAYLVVESLIHNGTYAFIYIFMLILSVTTIFSGLWLAFKGIDIITDDTSEV